MEDGAKKTIDAFGPTLSHLRCHAAILVARFCEQAAPDRDRWKEGRAETKALLKGVIGIFCRRRFCSADGWGQKYLGETLEAIRAMSMVDGKSAAYVCENFTCKAPVTDSDQLAELLAK
jgi:uncharacterized protein YyaL (SSP411 family)